MKQQPGCTTQTWLNSQSLETAQRDKRASRCMAAHLAHGHAMQICILKTARPRLLRTLCTMLPPLGEQQDDMSALKTCSRFMLKRVSTMIRAEMEPCNVKSAVTARPRISDQVQRARCPVLGAVVALLGEMPALPATELTSQQQKTTPRRDTCGEQRHQGQTNITLPHHCRRYSFDAHLHGMPWYGCDIQLHQV